MTIGLASASEPVRHPGVATEVGRGTGVCAAPSAWGWLAALSIVVASGVLVLAFADNAARIGRPGSGTLYWLGVLAIVVPPAMRIGWRGCAREERLFITAAAGTALYLLKVMAWPQGPTFHDDLGQLRTSFDIATSGHLFAPNPIVAAYAYYPGMEIPIDGLAAISGMSVNAAGFIIIGVARVVMMIVLFRIFELLSGSSRLAAVAAFVYIANPSFVYFDSQVAYESLALPLAVLVIFGGARGLERTPELHAHGLRPALGQSVVLGLVIGATVATHHMTAYFLTVLLASWALFSRTRWTRGWPKASLVLPAISFVATASWYLLAGKATRFEIGAIPSNVVSGIWSTVAGQAAPRQLFHAGNGAAEPVATQIIGAASAVATLFFLPVGVRRALRAGGPLSSVLVGLALLYPAALGLRLIPAGFELSNRASEFVYLGVGYVVAYALTGGGIGRRVTRRRASRRVFGRRSTPILGALCLAGLIAFLCTGGIINGWAPAERLPAPYQVGQPPRAIDAEGIQSADWAAKNLPPESPVIAGSAEALLLGAYGRQDPISGFIAGRPLLDLYRTVSLTPLVVKSLGYTRYLAVDMRMSTALPVYGGYFSLNDFTLGLRKPIPLAALQKFDHAATLDRTYDSGNIVIYRRGGA